MVITVYVVKGRQYSVHIPCPMEFEAALDTYMYMIHTCMCTCTCISFITVIIPTYLRYRVRGTSSWWCRPPSLQPASYQHRRVKRWPLTLHDHYQTSYEDFSPIVYTVTVPIIMHVHGNQLLLLMYIRRGPEACFVAIWIPKDITDHAVLITKVTNG